MGLFWDVLFAILVLGLFFCFGALVYIIGWEIRKCFLTYKKEPVTVKVVNKQHTAAYTTTIMMRVGKVTVPQMQHHPAKYEVILRWRGEDYPVDDEEVFNELEVGDTVLAMANVGYNKAGVEKDIYLTFE